MYHQNGDCGMGIEDCGLGIADWKIADWQITDCRLTDWGLLRRGGLGIADCSAVAD